MKDKLYAIHIICTMVPLRTKTSSNALNIEHPKAIKSKCLFYSERELLLTRAQNLNKQ